MIFQSPHRESYDRFISNLKQQFKNWLEIKLKSFKDKKIIGFDPKITIYNLEKKPSHYKEDFCIGEGIDYSEDLFLELSIEENQGKRRIYLGRIPILRGNGSFIINGKERVVVAQLAWSPGLFITEYIDSWEMVIRPEKGIWIKFMLMKIEGLGENLTSLGEDFPISSYIFNQKPKRVVFGNLLKSFGFRKEDLETLFNQFPLFGEAFYKTGEGAFWSKDYLRNANEKYRPTFISRLLNISKDKTESLSDDEVWSFNEKILVSGNFLGELGRWQINRKLRRLPGNENYNETSPFLTKNDIILSLRYLMHIASGYEPKLLVDHPWDLSNLKCRLIGDFLEEPLKIFFYKLGLGLESRIERYRVTHGQAPDADTVIAFIEEVNRTWEDMSENEEGSEDPEDGQKEKESLFSEKIKRFFTTSALSRVILDDNVLTAVGLTRRVTYGGEGGINIGHSRRPRDVHWSHYGRICPLDTPQSEEIGITLSLTPYAKVNHLGIIETPYHKVEWVNENCRINDGYEYLSSHDEEELMRKDVWIAYADQREKLRKGGKVFAHIGELHNIEVDCEKIGYIDIARDQQLSFAAKLIPFIQCNEGVRATMACSMIRQALPLKLVEKPLVATGFEKEIIESSGFKLGHTYDGVMAFGVNLLTMYLPWKGYNFEDAIVISESARNKLTSIERYRVCINTVEEYGAERIKKRRKILDELRKSDPKFFERYGEDGIIKEEQYVREGDFLVLEFVPRSQVDSVNLLLHYIDSSFGVLFNSYYTLRGGKEGVVKKVEIEKLNNRTAISILIERERIPQIGDKLANRHGHKGVISKILPDHQMPYFIDPIWGHDHCNLNNPNHKHEENRRHTHAEILLNPLGIISRMNLGQLYETHWGWVVKRMGEQEKIITPFGDMEIENLREKLSKTMKNMEKSEDFKIKVYDPTGQVPKIDSEVTVGYSYIMRLDHIAEEKEHARSKEPFSYSYLTQQPMKGKVRRGGQRLGEMEVWALMAHNTPKLLQEMMTLKSDNPEGRQKLYEELLEILKSSFGISPSLPDVLYTFSFFCLTMGLKLIFYDESNNPFSLLDSKQQNIDPEKISGVDFQLLSKHDIEKWSYGIIDDPTDGNSYTPRGIFSQKIFGPIRDYTCKCGKYKGLKLGKESLSLKKDKGFSIVQEGFICEKCETPLLKSEARRRRIGHIELTSPVVNILFLPYVAKLFGITEEDLKAILKDDPKFNFQLKEEAEIFFKMAYDSSKDLREGIEEKTGKKDITEVLEVFRKESNTPSQIGGAIARVLQEKHVSGVKFIADLLGYLSQNLNLNKLLEDLKEIKGEYSQSESKNHEKIVSKITHRCEIISRLKNRNQLPTQFLIEYLPVIPPGLRPRYHLGSGRYVLGDLNDHYIRIIRQNNRLTEFLGVPAFFKEELRRLQESVNALIWNERAWKKAFTLDGRRPLKSVASFFKGKKGFFKGNLLGKRVDYSARAVIVPDPTLKINECGISFKIFLKLYRPLLVRELNKLLQISNESKSIYTIIKILNDLAYRYPELNEQDRNIVEKIQEVMNKIRYEYPIILNRQPTLHRLSILAFYPDLVEDSVFFIPPLITGGYNADFDGDQMAAYLPITEGARNDVKRMLSPDHFFKPADGSLALNLSQDISLGIYYLTSLKPKKLEKFFQISIGNALDKKGLQDFMEKYLVELSPEQKVKTVEGLTQKAFEWATRSGLSYSAFDFLNLEKIGDKIVNDLSTMLNTEYKTSSISLTIISGARKDGEIIKQLIGPNREGNLIKGRTIGGFFEESFTSRRNLVDTKIGTAEAGQLTKKLIHLSQHIYVTKRDCNCSDGIPISKWRREVTATKAEWLQNLNSQMEYLGSPLECFIENEDGKFNKVDPKMIKDLSRETIVYLVLYREVKEPYIRNRLYGRILAKEIANYSENTFIGEDESENLARIIHNGETVWIRSPLTCMEEKGVCQLCYGIDLGKGRPKNFSEDWLIGLNENIGIIAAQSISEPATQLILRKKHGKKDEDISYEFHKARKFFEGFDESIASGDPLVMLDTIEAVYQEVGIRISSIHFEIMIRAMQSKHESLLAQASFANEVETLARWAVEGEKDYLLGLKEKVILGKRLHN